MPAQFKTIICTYWMQGKCRHCDAAECYFAHGAQDLQQPDEWDSIQGMIKTVLMDWNAEVRKKPVQRGRSFRPLSLIEMNV